MDNIVLILAQIYPSLYPGGGGDGWGYPKDFFQTLQHARGQQ